MPKTYFCRGRRPLLSLALVKTGKPTNSPPAHSTCAPPRKTLACFTKEISAHDKLICRYKIQSGTRASPKPGNSIRLSLRVYVFMYTMFVLYYDKHSPNSNMSNLHRF